MQEIAMPEETNKFEYARALEDFRRIRAKARMRSLWSAVTGQSEELLQYDDISKKMHISGRSSKGMREIPIASIVGSVNRYQDFDRNFLPLHDTDMERWANVKATMVSPGSIGLPPIKVYKIGEGYFVLDGNHRVSIAKQMEFDQIEAYVTEINTKVPFSLDDSPDELILKAEYADFLEETKFDQAVPGVQLVLTFPGLYETLKEHIRVHRHYMGIEQMREIPQLEAARHWYDNVYLPVVRIIREQNVLREFPQRTETDLYIWVLDHQTYMAKEYGWAIRPDTAAADLIAQQGKRWASKLNRLYRKLRRVFLPKQLEDFSSPGEWREWKTNPEGNLFSEILVPMNGQSGSWVALEQAVIIAKWERGDVRGLVVSDATKQNSINEDDFSRVFSEKLNQSEVNGRVVFAEGEIAEIITDRARFNDLIVLKLTYPPSAKLFKRLSSGFHTILRKSSRPVLIVKDQISVMNHLLLAYDGSPKGKEAMFVAAYLASRYQKRLSVVVVEKDVEKGKRLLNEAKKYLQQTCAKTILRRNKTWISKEILKVACNESADVIVMGGYGLSPLLELLFGSTVDSVLRTTTIPVIICQ